MKRALISVSDKTGIVDFSKELVKLGFEIVSTGGTFKTLQDNGINAIGISDVTGFPEILEGRVKTLHPKVHGGILAKDTNEHMAVLKEQGITPIDIVVVNLYPFQATIEKEGVTLEDAIENIDIGGPSMVRAAAKNYERVAIVVNPLRYSEIIDELKEEGKISLKNRKKLALEAFEHTGQYDATISQYLSKTLYQEDLPETFLMGGHKISSLRYGENPHQKAAFYAFDGNIKGTIAGSKQYQGKELSYNNIVDVEAAWSMVKSFGNHLCASSIIKHTNPCGTALGSNILEAYQRAFKADSMSAFGGIVGLNQKVNKETAEEIVKTFMEAVVAPEFSAEALEIFTQKKNLRVIEMGYEQPKKEMWIEKVSGGFLVQDRDEKEVEIDDLEIVTDKKPTEEELEELLFAWKVVKQVKSNAIVVAKDNQTIGVGAGQMNRVGSANIAFNQGGKNCRGAVLASDAFFPFRDTIDNAAKAGIKAIIQPGGSVRDDESIKACNEHHIAMVFTGVRHFKH
ncbi:IMP cyclohydrolase [Desulfonispora thiosulfatigenes DSM 11270]|uniref:Bifunctional purine biosynthesis protein PurH n=1 Tax=Desulfonispora thiosulfatigenes DSM 11270 TaxID=656914 RepID=A0A1W1VE15_DESTI|nr:bifunctional phosphoribosylaminoimidazolecarboxamide formyltransferase/IMP cyclohydrolase [Desulfonispora thiosulfatigenes]SMB91639.1 IMP cyclohydrolase [Desulfonispora thiosulfatigenes DSM 11270]